MCALLDGREGGKSNITRTMCNIPFYFTTYKSSKTKETGLVLLPLTSVRSVQGQWYKSLFVHRGLFSNSRRTAFLSVICCTITASVATTYTWTRSALLIFKRAQSLSSCCVAAKWIRTLFSAVIASYSEMHGDTSNTHKRKKTAFRFFLYNNNELGRNQRLPKKNSSPSFTNFSSTGWV